MGLGAMGLIQHRCQKSLKTKGPKQKVPTFLLLNYAVSKSIELFLALKDSLAV